MLIPLAESSIFFANTLFLVFRHFASFCIFFSRHFDLFIDVLSVSNHSH